jgi:hypothetical protein
MSADLGRPAGRRPICVLTRDAAIAVLAAITCAPITWTIGGIRSEVEVGGLWVTAWGWLGEETGRTDGSSDEGAG